MATYDDLFQQYISFQREAFEPFRQFTGVAAQTFERLALQNYAVLGDDIEFAVEQAKLPTQVTDVNDSVAAVPRGDPAAGLCRGRARL